jgi:hypothetical protein
LARLRSIFAAALGRLGEAEAAPGALQKNGVAGLV